MTIDPEAHGRHYVLSKLTENDMSTGMHVAVDATMIEEAERLGINVQRVVDEELRRLIDKRKIAKAWEDENREAIDRFNRYIDEHGTIGEAYRRYG